MSCCILTDDDVSKIFRGSAILTESTLDDPWFWFGRNKYLNGLKLEKKLILYMYTRAYLCSKLKCDYLRTNRPPFPTK